jgi:exonuclease III
MPGTVAKQWVRPFKLCTLNVRSIRTAESLATSKASISQVNFDIIGLFETRRSFQETLQLGSGYVLYNSGPIDSRSYVSTGVAFYMSQALSKSRKRWQDQFTKAIGEGWKRAALDTTAWSKYLYSFIVYDN